MAKNKSKKARRVEETAEQRPQGISWKTVAAILVSISTLVGAIVGGLDFINYLREGYQQFLWLGLAVLGVVWLIILWLLFNQRNAYGILWVAVTIVAGVVILNGWHSYIQTREAKLVVLIAEFDAPEEVYGLRNEILEKLNADFANDADIEIESVNEVITPDSDSGSPHAIELGKNFHADVVIWGWYRPTKNLNINIHVENLSAKHLPLKESENLRPIANLDELESFSFQQQVGQETSALISFLSGFIDYSAGDFDRSIKHFDQALAGISLQPRLFKITNDILFLRGNANNHLDNYWLAIDDFNLAVELDPNNAVAYNYRGISYNFLNEYKLAIHDFDAAIQIDPKEVAAYVNRGNSYAGLGDDNRAIQDYDQAIKIDPQLAQAYNNRGLSYATLQDYPRALDDYTYAIQIDPHDEDPYNNRGVCYATLGNYSRAIQDYDKAIKINPQDASAYINRGNAYSGLGNERKAIEDYTIAIELIPEEPGAYVNRGNAYATLADYDNAIRDYTKAIQINPQYEKAYYYRWLIYQKLGKTMEAEMDFKKYEELTGQKP